MTLEMNMEMHTRRSLEEIHGITVPPETAPVKNFRRSQTYYQLPAVTPNSLGFVNAVIALASKCAQLTSTPLILVSRELSYRRSERELMEMSDQRLKDIGIERWQIREAVRHGRTNRSEY